MLWKSKNKQELKTISDSLNDLRKDVRRNNVAWGLIGIGGVSLAVLFAVLFCGQRNKNTDLNQQNEKLKIEASARAKRMNNATKTISYMAGQRDQLIADLDNCRGGDAPKPAAKPQPKKPVAKPQPKPAPVAPVATPKPVVVRDTIRIRDTIRTVYASETPVAEPTKPEAPRRHKFTAVALIDLSANGYCAFSGNAKSDNTTVSADTVRNAVVADTVRNAIVADTISKAR